MTRASSPVLTLLLALLLLITVVPAGAAGLGVDTGLSTDDSLPELVADGWRLVAPGVLERQTAPGVVDHYTFGREGMEWERARLERDVARLRGMLETTGNPDYADALRARQEMLAELEQGMASAPAASSLPLVGAETLSCVLTVGRDASAGATSGGVEASATASYSDTCATTGCTYAEAEAYGNYDGYYRSTLEQYLEQCAQYTTPDATASVFLELDHNCTERGYARVKVLDNGNWNTFTRDAQSTACLTATIQGPTATTVGYGSCKTLTWSVSTSQPVNGWTWTYNGAVAGSAATFSRTFCSSATYTYTTTYSIGVTVSNDHGETASDLHTVAVTRIGYCDLVAHDSVDEVAESTARGLAVGALAQPRCDRDPVDPVQ